ncbi:MAG: MmcQ/YjbR family DNA-binding protein [Bacteroidia bacterium]
MNIELLRDHCMAKKGVEETFPFDEVTLVFKVMGKMFALTSLSEPNSVNLKCDPEKAIEFRANFGGVTPGFHMNKTHWNTVKFNEDVNDNFILEMVNDSYSLVVSSLTNKLKTELGQL